MKWNNTLDLAISKGASQPIFEALRISDRAIVLEVVRQLLIEWPYQFIELCKQSRVSSSYLYNYQQHLPYWFQSEIEWYLDDRDYAPSEEERASVATYLNNNGLPINANSINHLLGVSSVTHKTGDKKNKRIRWNSRGPLSKYKEKQ